MSQNRRKTDKLLIFWNLFENLLPCCLQHPSCHQKTPTAPLSRGHYTYYIFGAGTCELEATIVSTCFLKEVYGVSHSDSVRKAVLPFSKFQWHLRAASYLWLQCRTKIVPWLLGSALLIISASTSPPWTQHCEVHCRADAAEKKKFPFVPGYFPGRSDASAGSQHGPTNGCFPCWEGERREQPGWAGGGNCSGSWHWKETTLELWVDQPLLTLLSQLSPLPPRSLRQCPDSQHALTSHVKKQRAFSAR